MRPVIPRYITIPPTATADAKVRTRNVQEGPLGTGADISGTSARTFKRPRFVFRNPAGD